MRTVNEIRGEKDNLIRRGYLLEVERAGPNQATFDVLGYFALNDPYPGIRMNCLAGLRYFSELFCKPASEILIKALRDDSDPQVREVAASSLGVLRVHDAVPHLRAALASDPDPDTRERAAEALGRIGTFAARRALEAALSRESDAGVRLAAWDTLSQDVGDIDDPNARA